MAPWEASDLLNPELSQKSARLEERRRILRRNVFGVGCVILLTGLLVAAVWSRYHARQKLAESGFRLLGIHYHNYHFEHGRGPRSLSDLESFVAHEESGTLVRPEDEYVFDMIREGRFVVVWEAVFDGEPLGERILGYEARATERGGFVLLADGFVDYCTPSQLSAIPEIATIDK